MSTQIQGLKIGALLDHGKYRIEKILGQGGFGITYLVTDLGLMKLRAVKEFFPKEYCERDVSTSSISLGTSYTAELVKRLKRKFIKEARNIANLDQHSGIIKIHTVFEENNTAYYVMDYIEGESLSTTVKRNGPLPAAKAVDYIRQIGEALEYVHTKKINHLDVKPANLMVRRSDDKAILIDFGLAKQYDSEGNQTSTTPTGISHGFAPFEQYREGGINEFSPQTDIYSLAATLYYLVSGKVPPHATELIENALIFPEGFPVGLREQIGKAMAAQRQFRHGSVREFIVSLDGAVSEDETTVMAFPIQEAEARPPVETPVSKETPIREETPVPGGAPEPVREKTEVNKHAVERAPKHGNSGKAVKKIMLVLGAFVVAFLLVILIIYIGKPSKQPVKALGEEDPGVTVDVPKKVENMAYTTPFGDCLYTGEVDMDNKPDGYGVAKFTSGEGDTYDGYWSHGVMQGKTVYTLKGGDTFVGTFENNQYDKGRYTVKEDGSYFEGTFKDGQPYKGNSFDKNGNRI